jgi:CheY-like chemotaxis protein
MSLDLDLDTSRPLVMIVEDNPATRRASIRLLESFGCDVVGAESADRAIAEVWALPRLDLVCADIGLDPTRGEDMSGIRVARTLREVNPSIPLAAYSGKGFDLSPDDRSLFDLIEIKGGGIDADDLEEFFDDAVKLARSRSSEVRDEARKNVVDAEVSVLTDLRHILKRYVIDVSDPSEIEAALEGAGYQIRLVSPDAANGLRRPIIVWTQTYDGETVAQLFGRSSLYAIGRTDDEAVSRLIVSMVEELRELVEADDTQSSGEAELRAYLELVVEQL